MTTEHVSDRLAELYPVDPDDKMAIGALMAARGRDPRARATLRELAKNKPERVRPEPRIGLVASGRATHKAEQAERARRRGDTPDA